MRTLTPSESMSDLASSRMLRVTYDSPGIDAICGDALDVISVTQPLSSNYPSHACVMPLLLTGAYAEPAASSRSFLRARFSRRASRRSARSRNCRCSTPVSQ